MTKIDIFSGFLGAGKTTLIQKLIKEAYVGEKLVLIENEFGEIGIDGGFLKDSGVEITEMNSGCICCSLVGDFTKALSEVLERFSPDRVIIEPSGVGKLSDVIRAVGNALEGSDARLGVAVTVADASKCKIYSKNFGEFYNDQLENAGAVILSRTGDISEKKLQTAMEIVREKNALASLITTPWDQLDGKQILKAFEDKGGIEAELEEMMHEHHHHDHDEHCECGHDHHHHDHDEHCECGHDHDHEHHHHHHDEHCECGHDHEHHHHEHGEHCSCGCHDHHHHHADDVFVSFGRETAAKYEMSEIESALEALLDEHTYGQVLRAKGMVAGNDGEWIYFDYVPGESNVRVGSAQPIGKICVIGSGLDEAALCTLFKVEE